MTAEVSHGRGGAGNINADDTQYVDGAIVRAGPEGSRGDGAYSAGRGGAGNIGDAGTRSLSGRTDGDVIPEVAQRSDNGKHHTGRGGAGNEDKPVKEAAPETTTTSNTQHVPVGLADKLKAKLFGKK